MAPEPGRWSPLFRSQMKNNASTFITKLAAGAAIDWRKVKKRFTTHEEKIASQNGHFYIFGLELDRSGNADIQWFVAANKAVPKFYEKKNLSTYVDTKDGKILRPNEAITEDDAKGLVALAFECLRAHWRSETLTNPILYEAHESLPLGDDA